jgi:uncharacterized protein (TIGR02246 family)
MKRRSFAVAFVCGPLAPSTVVWAQAGAEEQKLRDALKRYQAAWNQHDVKAWSSFLTNDIWFTQTFARGTTTRSEKQQGREVAEGLFKTNFAQSDLSLEVKKLRMMPDGTATMALREVVSHLPKEEGKYRAVFESDPVISRWRKEGDTWKMFFYTSDKGWALAELKKDGLD